VTPASCQECSFPNACHTQSRLRTLLSYTTLHKLLFVYYNSRVVPEVPSSILPGPMGSLYIHTHTMELSGVEDGADDPKKYLETSAAVGAMAVDVKGKPAGALTSADRSAHDGYPPSTQFLSSH